DDASRMYFRRRRTGRSAPRHRHVRARVPGVAVACEGLRLEPELERGELRVLSEVLGRNLIRRDPESKIGAAGLSRMDAREERGGRAGVIAGAVGERAPVDLRV